LVEAAQAIEDTARETSERESCGAGAGAGTGAGGDSRSGGGTSGSGAGGDDGASGGGLGLTGLLQQLQFTSAQIADYVSALTDAGYDLVDDLAAVTMEELIKDAGMKKPHARRITTHFSQ
jgi:hypothetical protein